MRRVLISSFKFYSNNVNSQNNRRSPVMHNCNILVEAMMSILLLHYPKPS